MTLRDRTAIVTGAGSGIGRATVEQFVAAGARVIAVDRTKVDGPAAHAIACDVADSADVAAMADEIRVAFGRVHACAHFAGITADAQLDAMTLEAWNAVIAVNLTGSFLVAQAVARIMEPGGAIVLTSSISAYGNFGQSNYSASKAGVIGLTRTLALELGKRGIRVNALAPGFIATPMTQTVPEKIRDRAIDATPLRRIGTPDEVAQAALFLASDASSYITGQTLNVDGGRTIGTT